ncbi:MAG: hypothetical protein H6797_03955 [Candidatus Nomurabacteria bacterium]|nr:MAG: hypothetical protein H6797_03955 [Candidatus Nomurabacteria bacterium]
MYEQALEGKAVVEEQRGQWAVYVIVKFQDETHIGYINTFIHRHVAEFAAKVITTAMNRTDLRERGPIDY